MKGKRKEISRKTLRHYGTIALGKVRIFSLLMIWCLGVLVLCLVSSPAFSQNAEDIRDIQPPVDYPVNWIPLIIVLAVIVVSGALFYLWKRFHHPVARVVVEPKKPAWELAQAALADLQRKEYPSKGLIKLYYVELSDILRFYIESRFHIKAPEMTTEEFLESLRFSGTLDHEQQQKLQDFLTSCDMVKFAKYGASIEETRKSFVMVEEFIVQTKPHEKGADGI